MYSMTLFTKRTILAIALFALAWSIIGTGSARAEGAASNEEVAVIYYVSDGDLYRVKTDGSPAQRLRQNFDGVELKPAGDFMYYLFSEKSTTLLRLSLTDDQAKARDYGGDKRVISFETYGDMVYFMDDYGRLYRAASTVEKGADATLVADMIDVDFPAFTVVEDRIYYNALRNGRTTWVASKAADGSGAVQWIAAGALDSAYFAKTDSTSLNLMINTKPQEQQYSTDCMVLYTLPKKGGTAKAVNAKAPLDANAVYSGSWAGSDAYMYNKDIRLDGSGDYNYAKSKGHLLTKAGKTIELSKSGIYEIANLGANKYAYVGANGKAYVGTLANGKVKTTKALSLNGVGYVRNMMSKGKVKSTVLFGNTGAYVLNPDLTLKKMVGVEWDLCVYEDDIDGIFYVNAGDNGRLYRMTADGKSSTKLTDEKVSRIVLITKA
ncbi:DUF5050 domain-containing protein [Cohnella boryungensis]|uniref:DUF5050 domain-containing protein n=1 Tax=Cohnella boryungensis TaxID=768479 RepID=A0ABV8SHT1_9BACL